MEPNTRHWRPQLTQGEALRGLIFFVLYVAVFPFLLYIVRALLDDWFGLFLSDAAANAVFYAFCAAAVLLLFWAFLKNGFYILLDHWKENLFAMGSGLAGCVILMILVQVLPLPVENPVLYTYPEQYAASPAATVAILILFWPLVEETLFRGLIFGWLRRHGRVLAWTVSLLLFLLFKVWQFAVVPEGVDLRYLLVGVQYLPMALAFTWCYDVGGSIWSAVFLHMAVNGAGLYLVL